MLDVDSHMVGSLTVLMVSLVVLTLRALGRGDETDTLVDRDTHIGVHDIDRRRRLDLSSSAGIPAVERWGWGG
jgi:hypothetical protein